MEFVGERESSITVRGLKPEDLDRVIALDAKNFGRRQRSTTVVSAASCWRESTTVNSEPPSRWPRSTPSPSILTFRNAESVPR